LSLIFVGVRVGLALGIGLAISERLRVCVRRRVAHRLGERTRDVLAAAERDAARRERR
jgi:hypothetical protein